MSTPAGQYGPELLINHALELAAVGAVVTGPAGYTPTVDGFGNVTINGPASDAPVTFTVQPQSGAAFTFSVPIPLDTGAAILAAQQAAAALPRAELEDELEDALVPLEYARLPSPNGTAAAGTSNTAAPSDHVHSSLGGGGVLAVKVFNPTTAASYSSNSNTLVDIDTTNLAVTFTVPTSGQVLVTLNGFYTGVASTNVMWGLRNGTVVVGQTAMDYSTGGYRRSSALFLVTGLTAGASVTLKWAHGVATGTAATSLSAGGVTTGSYSGPAVMSVMSA